MYFANAAANQLAGGKYPIGMPFEEVIRRFQGTDEQGNLVPDTDWPFFRAARGESVRDMYMEWDTPGGKKSLLISSEPLPAESGMPEAVVVSYFDVTELKNIQRRLKEALGARDNFLSAASHELKTPLTTLILQSQLLVQTLSRDSSDVELLKRSTEQIERQAQRMSRLINELLDVSRIALNRLEVSPEPCDLRMLVDETVEAFQLQASGQGSKIEVTGDSSVTGQCDTFRIEQVIINLLTNAVRYGRAGTIHVHVAEQSDGVCFSVRDEGPGIPEKDIERIFDQFERAHKLQQTGGLGLGLYIARSIVEAHGGKISAANSPKGGAIFTVQLPAARW